MNISDTTIQGLVDLLTSVNVIMAAGAIWILILVANRLLPAKIVDHPYYQRVQPVVPELIGIGLTYVPGVMPDIIFASTVIGHIIFGMWMGLLSSKVFKVVSQSVLGHDVAINGKGDTNA